MKDDELLAILNDEELDVKAKQAKIQALNGADRQYEITKKETELAKLRAEHDTEKSAWEEEKKKFEGNVSKEEYDKTLNELNTFKAAKEQGKKDKYLKEILKVKPGYESMVSAQIDWSEASYDDEKKTFSGDKFTKSIEEVKKQYGILFDTEVKPQIKNTGYFPKIDSNADLTKL